MDALPAAVRLALSSGAYVLAYAAGLALFVWAARRRGIGGRDLRAVAFAGLFGGLVGAAVLQLLVSGEPGKTLIGGIAGGWIAVVLAKRSVGLRRPLGDVFAFAIAGGEAIGRFGCFFAGCCYGKIAHVAWAVHDHGELRHPTQLYSSLAAFATLGIIVWADRRRALPDNAIFYLQGALFCALRFVIEFYRDVPSYGTLTLAQYACVAGFAFFAYRLHAALQPRAVPADVTLSLSKGESISRHPSAATA
ncbi:MAG TPA: prolipoprotein diacylglyceryl transferase family protein [Candidatus Elarobacter sp.]|nr:prolipoprotein diacylglyceryl transferase family protein [Candidatus Elarobacter sp.]